MKMFGKIVAVAAALTMVAALPAKAQDQEGFTKQIEIEKDYSATIGKAERIEIEPRLLDTVVQRPTMEYAIKSTAHQSNFSVGALSPVEMSTAQWHRPTDFYLNAGVGAPLHSDLDLYWTPVQRRHTTLGVYVDHDGRLNRLTNLDEERLSALWLHNRAGVGYNTTFANGTKLRADVEYRGNVANPYGGLGVASDVERKLVLTNDVGADVSVAGGFGKNSKLGYEVALGGGWSAATNFGLAGKAQAEGTDHTVHYEADAALVGLNRVKGWLPHTVGAYFFGTHWLGEWQSSVVVMPEWSARVAKHLPIELAVGYDICISGPERSFVNGLVGNFEMAWDKDSRWVPYLRAKAARENDLVRMAMWLNPYGDHLGADMRKVYDASLGVRGSARRVNYNARVGLRHYSDYFYAVAIEGIPLLDYATALGVSMLAAEAQAEYNILRHFVLSGSVEYKHILKNSVAPVALGLRPLDARLGAEYVWKRWSFGVNGHYAMAAEYKCCGADGLDKTMSMPAYFDLGVEVEWRVTESMSAWLEGSNLLNQTIYHLPTYRQTGICALGGVRIVF